MASKIICARQHFILSPSIELLDNYGKIARNLNLENIVECDWKII